MNLLCSACTKRTSDILELPNNSNIEKRKYESFYLLVFVFADIYVQVKLLLISQTIPEIKLEIWIRMAFM